MTDSEELHFDSTRNLPRAHRSSRLRNYALGIVIGTVIAIVGLIAIVVGSRGKELPAISFESLDAAVGRWKENGPADYDLDVELSGINPGVAHVEVRHGEVTAMTHNSHATKPHTWDEWSIPGLFGVIRRDLEVCMAKGPNASPDAPIPRGVFDPKLGYPVQYHRVTPTGADAKWRITNFVDR